MANQGVVPIGVAPTCVGPTGDAPSHVVDVLTTERLMCMPMGNGMFQNILVSQGAAQTLISNSGGPVLKPTTVLAQIANLSQGPG